MQSILVLALMALGMVGAAAVTCAWWAHRAQQAARAFDEKVFRAGKCAAHRADMRKRGCQSNRALFLASG